MAIKMIKVPKLMFIYLRCYFGKIKHFFDNLRK